MKNYYKVLGIEKTASEGEIKKAYAVMVRKFPPEKEGEKFGEISEAYSTLSNKIKRTEYDKENGFDEVSQELLDGAKEFIDKKEYLPAIRNLKKFILLNPDNIVAKNYLSLCQYKIEDFSGVYENTKYIIDKSDEANESQFDNFVIAAKKLNKFNEAEKYLLKAIEKFDSIHFYIEMCSLYSNKNFKNEDKIKEILTEKINPRLDKEELSYQDYNDLAFYASSLEDEKLIEFYLNKLVSNVKVQDFDSALSSLEDCADLAMVLCKTKILVKYTVAMEDLTERFISLKSTNEKRLKKLKSLKRIFGTIKPIIMNTDICYEVKSYIINNLRSDLTSNEKKINELNEENLKLIEKMSEMAIKEPEVLRSSIMKIKKNDLIYLRVRDVFNKYYKITSPKPEENTKPVEEVKEEPEKLEVTEEKITKTKETKEEEEGFFGKIKNFFGNKGKR